MTNNAEITKDVRELLDRLHEDFIVGNGSQAMHRLADFIAAREKATRLKGLRDAYTVCEEYRKREYGPHGTEWVSCEDVNEVKDEIAEKIRELEAQP